jgi:hypothetical protein
VGRFPKPQFNPKFELEELQTFRWIQGLVNVKSGRRNPVIRRTRQVDLLPSCSFYDRPSLKFWRGSQSGLAGERTVLLQDSRDMISFALVPGVTNRVRHFVFYSGVQQFSHAQVPACDKVTGSARHFGH